MYNINEPNGDLKQLWKINMDKSRTLQSLALELIIKNKDISLKSIDFRIGEMIVKDSRAITVPDKKGLKRAYTYIWLKQKNQDFSL